MFKHPFLQHREEHPKPETQVAFQFPSFFIRTSHSEQSGWFLHETSWPFSKHQPQKKNTTTPTTKIQATKVSSSFFGTLKPRIFTVLSMRPRISSTGGCPTKRAASPGWNEAGSTGGKFHPQKIPDTRSAQAFSPLPSFKPNPFEQKKGWFL